MDVNPIYRNQRRRYEGECEIGLAMWCQQAVPSGFPQHWQCIVKYAASDGFFPNINDPEDICYEVVIKRQRLLLS